MKKNIIALIVLAIINIVGTIIIDKQVCKAEEVGDSWNEMMDFDNSIQGQKPITDSEFNKVVKQLEQRKKTKRKKKNEIPLPNQMEQNEMSYLKDHLESTITILLPTESMTKDAKQIIPIGFYKLVADIDKTKEKNHYINLYQGHRLIAKIEARETLEDFGQESINFAKIIQTDDQRLKVIYGSLDVNLEADLIIAK